MSFLTARRLSPYLVDEGVIAHFGYDENFTFVHTLNVTDTLDDPIADVFFQCSSRVDRLVTDGFIAGRLYDEAKELFRQKYEKYLAIDSDIAMTLLHDHDCFRYYGDQEASLPSEVIQEFEPNTPISDNLNNTDDTRETK